MKCFCRPASDDEQHMQQRLVCCLSRLCRLSSAPVYRRSKMRASCEHGNAQPACDTVSKYRMRGYTPDSDIGFHSTFEIWHHCQTHLDQSSTCVPSLQFGLLMTRTWLCNVPQTVQEHCMSSKAGPHQPTILSLLLTLRRSSDSVL